ncbi:metallophosphoesterase [Anaerotignum lactatifermentans]|uniref:Metallophosphoesterase n=1 Tax=Anaerotignum lactatifermentans TaxID=160404 RepID=A0ABS2G648_9FIRM|nr:metallophosphoesterase [Anaerotignum lactatifermentans]MBM6828905.1 metallophosphoesterase [Anaerotignum lactatifermentans]MBM6876921.1 metallophosphoesterase [Anaerotignum lactatifermentans]MBM6950480.1 metallophosphoesterase [Anaerotignum lactatifermentans]
MNKSSGKLLCAAAAAGAFLYWQDNGLMVSQQYYKGDVPEAFHGFKILHISDLQNKRFGKKQKNLIYRAECSSPDMIVITGDLIDRNRTNLDAAMELIDAIVDLAPVYYVSGNHEHQSGRFEELAERLTKAGVKVMNNGKTVIERDGDTIVLLGLTDKWANPHYRSILHMLCQGQEDAFKILLSHRPELFEEYVEEEIDLICCGHAHGGQIRLPGINGVFAPNQGFLPAYTAGMYREGKTAMVVSRGLGNSSFPFRIGNRPELVEITLMRKGSK